jgi:hypothetical protein
MKLSVISAAYTPISPSASFKTRRMSPDAILCSLSGSPAVMSDLAIVTDAPVSAVTRHGLTPIQPLAFRSSSLLLFHTLSVWESRGGGGWFQPPLQLSTTPWSLTQVRPWPTVPFEVAACSFLGYRRGRGNAR